MKGVVTVDLKKRAQHANAEGYKYTTRIIHRRTFPWWYRWRLLFQTIVVDILIDTENDPAPFKSEIFMYCEAKPLPAVPHKKIS